LNLLTSPASLYIDPEGVRLSRHGAISLPTLDVLPTDEVQIIDIHTLGASDFSTCTQPNHKADELNVDATKEPPLILKSILESSIIPKVFFDVHTSPST
jgi:exonuclease 3'-5' domain-containing protein 1